MIAYRFAVDKMLGRLATWLRLIGQDATYGSHRTSRGLLRHARAESRTILTRDHRVLAAGRDLSVIFILSNDFREQLAQVINACRLDPAAALFTRCTACNTLVVAVPKAQVASLVPPYVFASQQRFARCTQCGRTYWSGTHYRRVRTLLEAMGYRLTPEH
jgi:uncharacterized protein